MGTAEPADVVNRLPCAGRCFGMHKGDGLHRSRSQESGLNRVRFDDLAPGGFHPDRFAAATFNHCSEACAKDPVDADDDCIARLHEIHDRRFHAGRSGAGDCDGEPVRSREDLAEQRLNIVHYGEEGRVEVAEKRHRHGSQHPRVHHTGAWAQQQPPRWKKFLHGTAPSFDCRGVSIAKSGTRGHVIIVSGMRGSSYFEGVWG